MKNSREFWDKAARRYAKSPIRDEKSYQRKLAITREYLRPHWSLLEFGCGTGSTAVVHAPYVRQILATDISAKMLEIAQERARDAGAENITFQQGTLQSLELQADSFDAVLGLNILHLLEDVEMAVTRVYDVLKPGGAFVSSTVLIGAVKVHWRLLIRAMQLLGLAPYVNRFDKQELVSLLTRTGFTVDYEWQPGRESVFIVARK